MEPMTAMAVMAGVGAIGKGIEYFGQKKAQSDFEKSDLGKAQAAVVEQAGKTAQAGLDQLKWSDEKRRKFVAMGLEKARAGEAERLAQRQAAGKAVPGAFRGGMEQVADITAAQGIGQTGAQLGAEAEALSTKEAIARKTQAEGILSKAAAADLAQRLGVAKIGGEALTGMGLGATAGYLAGDSSVNVAKDVAATGAATKK